MEKSNYYEILELSPKATWKEIQMAYELAKKTYAEGGMASYSLFDKGERDSILSRIEEAYHVLSDPKKKSKYDAALADSGVDSARTSDASHVPATVEVIIPDLITGEVIRALRQKSGVSLEEIAETTRININYLESIEKDRFDFLPAEVYVYGYLRQVAGIIHCADKVVEGYMQVYRASRQSKK
jgi:curved DNA-binding protein CbpA